MGLSATCDQQQAKRLESEALDEAGWNTLVFQTERGLTSRRSLFNTVALASRNTLVRFILGRDHLSCNPFCILYHHVCILVLEKTSRACRGLGIRNISASLS